LKVVRHRYFRDEEKEILFTIRQIFNDTDSVKGRDRREDDEGGLCCQ